jgi:Asp-tRNA(Asn)/Glu-tRNA(Gln) amidotransferase C subunit
VRYQSTRGLDAPAIEKLQSKPSWSVEALHGENSPEQGKPSITKKQLHHLLHLSALPLPKSEAEEAEMIKTLENQLNFVRAVQSVDTAGVEPLQSLRDETTEAKLETEITLDSLKEHLDKESSVGFAGRIVRKTTQKQELDESDKYDPISRAPKTIGRYVVVNTKES